MGLELFGTQRISCVRLELFGGQQRRQHPLHRDFQHLNAPFNGVSQCRYCNSSSLTQPTSLLGGWDGGRGTVQYTTVLACAEDLHSSDARGLYSTKKNYLKVLVQIFFDCSLVDLFINLCVI